MPENYKLIKQCQKGSNKAFDELLRTYSGLIYGICLRYCKNRTEAEDLLHECLIKIIEKIGEFQFKGSFEGWVKTLTVRMSINYLRDKKKFFLEDIDEHYENKVIAAPDDVISKLSEEHLIKLISELPTGCQTIFNLFGIEGYSHAEIAEMFGIQESTSRTQYKKAREMLIKKINRMNRK